MPIEPTVGGGFIATDKGSIRLVQLHAQKGAIQLEAKGMKRSGRSLTAILKEHYGVKTREGVLRKLEDEIREMEIVEGLQEATGSHTKDH